MTCLRCVETAAAHLDSDCAGSSLSCVLPAHLSCTSLDMERLQHSSLHTTRWSSICCVSSSTDQTLCTWFGQAGVAEVTGGGGKPVEGVETQIAFVDSK